MNPSKIASLVIGLGIGGYGLSEILSKEALLGGKGTPVHHVYGQQAIDNGGFLIILAVVIIVVGLTNKNKGDCAK